MLGNREGLAPKIDSTYVRNACLLLKGPKCCVLEGSPIELAQLCNLDSRRFSTLLRWHSCAVCTGPASD